MYEDTEKDFSSVKSYCKLGSLCGEVQDGKKCVEMFSLPDGAKSNNKYLCQSGLIDKNKCVSSKIANDTCAFPYELDKCEIEVNDGVSMTNTKVSCIEYYDKESLCPQQSDSQIWNDFIT